MNKGLKIGRIFGITIRLDWSWFLIFILITWSLGAQFGELHPDWGTFLHWAMALLASLLFFVSVLAHEMAHSLIAQARGVPVRNITLFLFGGVSNIRHEPDSPSTEFFMAILGPVTSLVIGGVLLLIVGLTLPIGGVMQDPRAMAERLGPLATIMVWLGSINIILGVFNMIPGFPLDGGRVVRSILWAITGNLRRATRWASWLGQGIAWIMIVAGVAMAFGVRFPFLGTGLINGLWFAFIGWFLNSASERSYQQVVIQNILEGVPVARLMRTDPPVVSPERSVSDLVHGHIMGSDDHAFPVLDGDRILGIVCLDDVRSVPRDQWEVRSIGDIMTPVDQMVTAAPSDDAGEAFGRLSERDLRQLPVVHNGRLVGLLRRTDIVRYLQLQSNLV